MVFVSDPLLFALVAAMILGAVLLLRRDRKYVPDEDSTLDVQNHIGDRR